MIRVKALIFGVFVASSLGISAAASRDPITRFPTLFTSHSTLQRIKQNLINIQSASARHDDRTVSILTGKVEGYLSDLAENNVPEEDINDYMRQSLSTENFKTFQTIFRGFEKKLVELMYPTVASVRTREAVAPVRVTASPREVFYDTDSDSDSEYDDY